MSNRKERHIYYHGVKEHQARARVNAQANAGLVTMLVLAALCFIVWEVLVLLWQAMVWCWHLFMTAVYYVFVVPWHFICLHWIWAIVIGGLLVFSVIVGEMDSD